MCFQISQYFLFYQLPRVFSLFGSLIFKFNFDKKDKL